ncbi:hypothetical protein ACFXG4_23500 [Nocardia sp. NPDC059246]|uniref:hypothetical protein n=1 Tax=unclassified Nocardia TaxID=2637762 RepID=UPI0036BC7494
MDLTDEQRDTLLMVADAAAYELGYALFEIDDYVSDPYREYRKRIVKANDWPGASVTDGDWKGRVV